jgi:riboflavin biosynthesis pyrimidine reductase
LRSLLPEASEQANVLDLYSRDVKLPRGRPFVRVNMISSLDGATAVAGRSGGLGGQADKRLFSLLRTLADVVLVGAGTVRTERYGPPEIPLEVQEERRGRGQAPVPPIAVVTQSCVFDWRSDLFCGGGPRPIVITPGTTDANALAQAREVADVLTTGTGAVDMASALKALHNQGMQHVLCEGGPRLNTSLAAAQLVDELCLTLSPQLAGCVGGVLMGGWLGSGGVWLARTAPNGERTFRSQPLAHLLKLDLTHVLEEDGYLFLRLRASQRGGPPAICPPKASPPPGAPGGPNTCGG